MAVTITKLRMSQILAGALPDCGIYAALELAPTDNVDCIVSMTAEEFWELSDDVEVSDS